MVDVLHAVLAEGMDLGARVELDERIEPAGHEARAAVNPAYKRATWGRRPEDAEALQATMGDLAGRRTR